MSIEELSKIYKPPFRLNRAKNIIIDSEETPVVESKGWFVLSLKGTDAYKTIDGMMELIVELLNDKFNNKQ